MICNLTKEQILKLIEGERDRNLLNATACALSDDHDSSRMYLDHAKVIEDLIKLLKSK